MQMEDFDIEGQRDRAIELLSYIHMTPNSRDIRTTVFGMDKGDSQFKRDMAWASGEMKEESYLFHTYIHDNPFIGTGKHEGYWPHMNYDNAKLDAYQEAEMNKILSKYNIKDVWDLDGNPNAVKIAQERDSRIRVIARAKNEDIPKDGLLNEEIANEMMPINKGVHMLHHMGENVMGNMLNRTHNLPGYSTGFDVVSKYSSKLLNSIYNSMAGFYAKQAIKDFKSRNLFGNFTQDHEFFNRTYVRDVLGGPSIIPDELMNSKTTNIRMNPYWIS